MFNVLFFCKAPLKILILCLKHKETQRQRRIRFDDIPMDNLVIEVNLDRILPHLRLKILKDTTLVMIPVGL